MINVGICGACGKMGLETVKAVHNAEGLELKAVVDFNNDGKDIGELAGIGEIGVAIQKNLDDILDKVDVVVDFTNPDSVFENAKKILIAKKRPVIGTTGLSAEQVGELEKLSKQHGVGCLIAPNFATGAVLMMIFAKEAAKYFDNAEIIELHHNRKKDAPSGTALKTAEMMAEAKNNFTNGNIDEVELVKGSRGGVSSSDIHIHSVRMPGYVASQEVIFGAGGQTLKIRHDSIDRTCFMPGVVMSIKYIMANNEFVFGLDKIMD